MWIKRYYLVVSVNYEGGSRFHSMTADIILPKIESDKDIFHLSQIAMNQFRPIYQDKKDATCTIVSWKVLKTCYWDTFKMWWRLWKEDSEDA